MIRKVVCYSRLQIRMYIYLIYLGFFSTFGQDLRIDFCWKSKTLVNCRWQKVSCREIFHNILQFTLYLTYLKKKIYHSLQTQKYFDNHMHTAVVVILLIFCHYHIYYYYHHPILFFLASGEADWWCNAKIIECLFSQIIWTLASSSFLMKISKWGKYFFKAGTRRVGVKKNLPIL